MIKITNPADCCGCTACASICPHNAITMKPNLLGFLYPVVDESKCMECGLCEKVCAFNDHYDCTLVLQQPEAYAARHRNIDEVLKSRSGAAFVAISDYILEVGGVVYGAGYKDHFRVAHKRAITKEERDEFRGSKYVQSDLTGVFRLVKKDLVDGLIVLFSGTPCQTAALNSYISEKLRKSLVLVDIICHGVPGPYIWRDYLAYRERQAGDELCCVNFRDKKYGWASHIESFKFRRRDKESCVYSTLFNENIVLRQSCGICHYCNLKRPSDITIADFWGGGTSAPNFFADNKGCSLMLINIEKGQEILKAIQNKIDTKKVPLEKCMQPNLQYPTLIHPKRDMFEKDYEKFGFEKTLRKYGYLGWQQVLRELKRKYRMHLSEKLPASWKAHIKRII